jgi:Na+-transporting NADH:ubiquinone oxidoreductase subunit NqrC
MITTKTISSAEVYKDSKLVTNESIFSEEADIELKKYYQWCLENKFIDLSLGEFIGMAASMQVLSWIKDAQTSVDVTQTPAVKKLNRRDRRKLEKKRIKISASTKCDLNLFCFGLYFVVWEGLFLCQISEKLMTLIYYGSGI